MRPCHAALLRNASHDVDYCAIFIDVERLAEFVGLRPIGDLVPCARQAAAGQWAPGHDGYAELAAERQHLALFLAIKKIEMILHADELTPATLAGCVDCLCEPPCRLIGV